MRKLLLSLSCITLLSAEQMYLYEVSPIIGVTENGTGTGLERSIAYGLQLQYNDIDFFIKPELTYIYSPNIKVYDVKKRAKSHLLIFNGVYDLEYTALLTPFLKAGAGYQSITDLPGLNSDSFLIGTGAGLKLHIRDKIALKFEAMYTLHDFSESNILVFGGVNFSFGNEDNTPAVEYTPPPAAPVEVNTTKRAEVVVVPPAPVYISKADLNLTEPQESKQEVVMRDSHKRLSSLTLFVPYLFRGYELDDDSKVILSNYAKELQHEDANVTIIGHTNSKGRRAFNMELSLKRAKAVEALFIDNGVAKERITVVGKGESEPLADKNNPAATQLNKRIEIKIKY